MAKITKVLRKLKRLDIFFRGTMPPVSAFNLGSPVSDIEEPGEVGEIEDDNENKKNNRFNKNNGS